MASALADAFAPLNPDEEGVSSSQAKADQEELVCTPVPERAEDPASAASRLYGRPPDAPWIYKDQTGRLLYGVARWNKRSGGKDIRPLAWVRRSDGTEGWAFRHHPSPRPIYNLDQLFARPDATVVVCEGEKTADAAALIFPDCVSTTSPAGAYAADKADWSPVAGRRVIILPDANDAPDKSGTRPGEVYAQEVAAQAFQSGAAEVILVDTAALSRLLPDGSLREGPSGWDVADALHEGWSPEELRTIIDTHPDLHRVLEKPTPVSSYFISFGPFTMDPVQGLSVEIETKSDVTTHFVSGPFEVLGRVRTPDRHQWARLLRWRDDDGRVHTHAVPDDDLHMDVKALAASLARQGLTVSTGRGRTHLAAYLNQVRTDRRVIMVDRTGWHEFDGQLAFVLPQQSFGHSPDETVILRQSGPTPYEARGSLEDRQDSVGHLVCGHSRLMFAVSAAFAGSLLKLTNKEGGGINFFGPSSIGKSTAVAAAASVHGRGASPGFMRSWRSTANALEGAAALHSDTLLVLDELGLVEAKDAAAAVYQLVTGTSKGRSHRDGTLRDPMTWLSLVLSTGEIRLADKLRESNQRAMAGQAVRLIDIPADAGHGFGVFDHTGESATANELANRIKEAVSTHYGSAGPAFMERVIRTGVQEVAEVVLLALERFKADVVPAGADGQVLRVAERFGLIAAAGELARELGVLPWPEGAAYRAAAVCFEAWLGDRGGVGSAEVEEAVAQVRRFVEAHGQSRFEAIGEVTSDKRPIINQAGFRRGSGEAEEWWVLPEAWKRDVCTGLDPRRTARILADQGMLVWGPSGAQSVRKIAGRPRRVYVLTCKILAGEADE